MTLTSRPRYDLRPALFGFLGALALVAMFAMCTQDLTSVSARSGGITGYSGAGTGSGGGSDCTSCHSGTVDALSSDVDFSSEDVTIDLDADEDYFVVEEAVTSGAVIDLTLTMTDEDASVAGFNIAVEDGVLDSDDSDVDVTGSGLGEGELIHFSPDSLSSDMVSWEFNWEAPEVDEETEFTIYAAVNAANGNRTTSGDTIKTQELYITVAPAIPNFLRGDANADGEVSVFGDGIAILEWGFDGGDTPVCLDAADVDNNGVNSPLVDTIYLLSWGFLDGDEPPAPGVETCGPEADDDDDEIGCAEDTCEVT